MATNVVKARKTALKANFSASAVQLTLDNLLDSRGDPIVMASFGDWFVLVIKQGSQVEIVKCDGLTQNGNGSATCDVATNGRNIDPIPPYEGGASGFSFLAGAEVIVTNDPLTMMYYLFNNENTWLQKQTFSVAPESSVDAVTSNALVRKTQLDSAVLGVVTSVSVVVEGIAGETIADGDLIYFSTVSDAWLKCDADTAGTVNNTLLGLAQGSGTIGNLIANGVMLRGTDNAQSGMSAGDIMYASNTAGDISNVAGTTPVAVGIAKSATELYFEPRFNTGLSQNQVNALNGANNPSGSNVFLTANDATQFTKRGGTGADGALNISSGTTNFDLGGANIFVKNYTSISITGTANITFTNPAVNGTVVVFKSQGNVTINSSANPTIDLRAIGAQAGTVGSGSTSGHGASGSGGSGLGSFGQSGSSGGLNTNGTHGTAGTDGFGLFVSTPAGTLGNNTVNVAPSSLKVSGFTPTNGTTLKPIPLACGSGAGGSSSANGSTSGQAGRGGGALYIECGGAYNFVAGVINASGQNGGIPTGSPAANGASGGGGGTIAVIYETLTADTGTYTVTGGTGSTSINFTNNGVSGGNGVAYRVKNNDFA